MPRSDVPTSRVRAECSASLPDSTLFVSVLNDGAFDLDESSIGNGVHLSATETEILGPVPRAADTNSQHVTRSRLFRQNLRRGGVTVPGSNNNSFLVKRRFEVPLKVPLRRRS